MYCLDRKPLPTKNYRQFAQLPYIHSKRAISTEILNMHIHFAVCSPITAGDNWRIAHHSTSHGWNQNHHEMIHVSAPFWFVRICKSSYIVVAPQTAPLRPFQNAFLFLDACYSNYSIITITEHKTISKSNVAYWWETQKVLANFSLKASMAYSLS